MMSWIIISVMIVSLPLAASCPKQINSFDVNEAVKQVTFANKKDPGNIARHSLYKNWQGLRQIHNETQYYVLICFIGAFAITLTTWCLIKLGRSALRSFHGVRNELEELRMRTVAQTEGKL